MPINMKAGIDRTVKCNALETLCLSLLNQAIYPKDKFAKKKSIVLDTSDEITILRKEGHLEFYPGFIGKVHSCDH